MRSRIFSGPIRAATLAAAMGLLAWGAVWSAAREAGQDKPAPRSGAEFQGLIRKDLLDRSPSAEVRPRRNIFIRSGGPAEEPPPAASLQPQAQPPAGPAEPAAEGPEIRYVGCVVTARRTVAIVLVAGQALAVVEGDPLAGMFTVQKVGPEALVLVDAQGQTRTISIRGEKQ